MLENELPIASTDEGKYVVFANQVYGHAEAGRLLKEYGDDWENQILWLYQTETSSSSGVVYEQPMSMVGYGEIGVRRYYWVETRSLRLASSDETMIFSVMTR